MDEDGDEEEEEKGEGVESDEDVEEAEVLVLNIPLDVSGMRGYVVLTGYSKGSTFRLCFLSFGFILIGSLCSR